MNKLLEKIEKRIDEAHLEILDTIKWEHNGMVRSNERIKSENIVPKSSTDAFGYNDEYNPPCSVTVRITNQRHGYATIYFKGKVTENQSSWGGKYYNSDSGTMKVTLPQVCSWKKQVVNFQQTGTLPINFSECYEAAVKRCVRKEVERMSGKKVI